MRQFRLGYAYDPEMDPATWKGYKPQPWHLRPKWKQEAQSHKTAKATKANAAKRRDSRADHRQRREEAEQGLAETVRRAVQALEMGMAHLKEVGIPQGGYQTAVNQAQLHNAIFFLKTKCGVKFDTGENEYAEAVQVDRVHLKHGYETEYDRRKRLEREEAALDLGPTDE